MSLDAGNNIQVLSVQLSSESSPIVTFIYENTPGIQLIELLTVFPLPLKSI
jgi:hypothetical protein